MRAGRVHAAAVRQLLDERPRAGRGGARWRLRARLGRLARRDLLAREGGERARARRLPGDVRRGARRRSDGRRGRGPLGARTGGGRLGRTGARARRRGTGARKAARSGDARERRPVAHAGAPHQRVGADVAALPLALHLGERERPDLRLADGDVPLGRGRRRAPPEDAAPRRRRPSTLASRRGSRRGSAGAAGAARARRRTRCRRRSPSSASSPLARRRRRGLRRPRRAAARRPASATRRTRITFPHFLQRTFTPFGPTFSSEIMYCASQLSQVNFMS